MFLSQIIDPQGNALTLNYDGQQRLVSLTDATGRQTAFSYELANRPLLITKITDPFGRSATLSYDASFRLRAACYFLVFRVGHRPKSVQRHRCASKAEWK